MKSILRIVFAWLISSVYVANAQQPIQYWNVRTQLIPWRPIPSLSKPLLFDLDKDGDPDLIKMFLNDSVPVLWIDDDDDMNWENVSGDTDNDCLLLDRNRDGIFAGAWDFSVDWCDSDGNGKADIQLVVNNGGAALRNYWDWSADYMWFFDDDQDGIMHYIDWNRLTIQAWEHTGHANFFKDYQGNSTFLKMHASSFRISDLRYNWENPFIFCDDNKDGFTDWAIRLVDSPVFREKDAVDSTGFKLIDTAYDIRFDKKIDYAALTWDLDQDNNPGNEFDFDMSLLFKGKGFSYEGYKQKLTNWGGLRATDSLFYDSRWRKLDHLYFPDRTVAYDAIFKKGIWQESRLVFDEDDDCNRWERVEFYDPRDIFISGTEKGGLDHNKQADVAGDRGEFDLDNSGKGALYIGGWDKKIHLFGAEWGAWRIDQLAYAFQGFGGNYERWGRDRLQRPLSVFASVVYKDDDKNGFIDKVLYDLNGDQQYEDSISFQSLGIEDKQPIIDLSHYTYRSYKELFTTVAKASWSLAEQAIRVARQSGLDLYWYNFLMQPKSVHQQYEYGYWLNFYLYQDLRYQAKVKGDTQKQTLIDKAYYSGNWDLLNQKPTTLSTADQVQAQVLKTGLTGKHPRLFFDSSDLVRIQQLSATGDPLLKMGVSQQIEEAQRIKSLPLFSYELDEAKLRIPSIHQFASQLPNLVMAYRLTGDTTYAYRAFAQLEKMAGYPDWGANRHFLDAGIGAFNVALAYDALYEYLGEKRRAILREAVKKFVMLPALEQLEKNTWWSTAQHNWNGICNGGIIMAALAIYESDSILMSKLISLAVNKLPFYIRSFEPDGQSEEGLLYWSYGLMYTTITLESLKRVLGTQFGLDQNPGFKKTGWFPAFVSGPVTSLNIGDDPIKNTRGRSFFWFAHQYNDTLLARWQASLCLDTKVMSWMDMVYYDPGMLRGTTTQNISLDTYTRGIEVLTARTDTSSTATFIALHGGKNYANHGHLDAGSFDIQSKGEVWAYGNLGRDDYVFPGYFSKQTLPGYLDKDTAQSVPGRWHFYRLRAEGKNCLVINPDTRPDQNEKGEARVTKFISAKDKSVFELDLSSCYDREVDYYFREVEMNRSTGSILIVDSLKAIKNSRLWWQLHTKAAIRISADGRSAILQLNGKQMRAVILQGGKGFFAELPATYLPGQKFPLTKNSPNTDFKKLVFETGDFNEGVIKILISPFENSDTVISSTRPKKLVQPHFKLATPFQDYMVCQQNKPFSIWGSGTPGATINVIAGWGVKAQALVDKEGAWKASLFVPSVSKGDFREYTLSVSSGMDSLVLKHIQIGEVWFCSGQSNMEMTMQALPPWHKGVVDFENEIKKANDPTIRLFKVTRETAAFPRDTVNATWTICSPASIATFSGVAYYFAKKLQEQLNVPVGMITASFGGASCQAFIKKEVLERDSLLRVRYWNPYLEKPDEKQPHLRPSLIYNAIIHPLMPFSVKGILWYQGESNAGDILWYDYLNKAMIESWRSEFQQGELPFYFVQMTPYDWKKSPYESGYARFREAQQRVLSLSGTGMICTMDVGDSADIHPVNKKPVGERLAALALNQTYVIKTLATGPVFKKVRIRKDIVQVHFVRSSVTKGLSTNDGNPPRNFFVAANDSIFYPAQVQLQKRKLLLQSDQVKNPIAVRYAFFNGILTNLQNKQGWPAWPFRTDRWSKEKIEIKK